jgi:tetratricopeptide (TPR) repeat protein
VTVAKARMLIDVARWDDAQRELATALADPGAGAEPWCLLAQVHLELGRPEKAQVAAQRAVVLDPGDEWAHSLLAIALLGQGSTKAAEAAARRAAALDPDDPHTLYELATVLLGRGSRREAREVAQHNIAVNPQAPLAWESASEVAAESLTWPEAETYARAGLSLAPEDHDLLILLSRAIAGQGRMREASQPAAAAIRADPSGRRGRRQLEVLGSIPFGSLSWPMVASTVLCLIVVVTVDEVPGRLQVPLLLAVVAVIIGLNAGHDRRRLAALDPVAVAAAHRMRRGRARIVLICFGLALILLSVPILLAVTSE